MSDLIASDLHEDDKNGWGTDPDVFHAMNKEFNFDLDAAASENNAKCSLFLTKEQNSLKINWSILRTNQSFLVNSVWINPPYGRGLIKLFMGKCIEQKNKGITSVMLVPATLDTQWLPLQDISEIRIITGGRLSFHHPITNKKISGNTKGSMFVIFRPSKLPYIVRLIDRDEFLNG